MLELALTTFMTLFVIVDPPGNLPIFISLTAGTSASHQRSMAIKAPVIALCVLLVFALVGERLLNFIGIEMPAFRIAGGLMLLLVALEMVFEKTAQRKSDSANKVHQRKLKASAAAAATPSDQEKSSTAGDQPADSSQPAVDVSVFPLAIPILAGPGAITTVLLLISQQSEGWLGTGVVLGVVVLLMALCMALFLLASRLDKLLGATVTNILTRLFGVILAALSIQFVIDGVKQAFSLTS